MDHDNTGGVVSGSSVDCSHNHCGFDLIIYLPYNFEERYKFCMHGSNNIYSTAILLYSFHRCIEVLKS